MLHMNNKVTIPSSAVSAPPPPHQKVVGASSRYNLQQILGLAGRWLIFGNREGFPDAARRLPNLAVVGLLAVVLLPDVLVVLPEACPDRALRGPSLRLAVPSAAVPPGSPAHRLLEGIQAGVQAPLDLCEPIPHLFDGETDITRGAIKGPVNTAQKFINKR